MTKQKAEWNWRPAGPILLSPLLEWPFRPKAILQWLIAGWHLLGIRVGVLVIAILSWFYLQPALERCVTFQIGWILEIYIRNLCLMILVAGGCHLYFITYSKQGNKLKFDSRAMMRDSRVFLFSDQVKDNIFWTLASGVTIWTGYEVLLMWGFANGYASLLMWQDNPVWFIALLFLQPIWGGFHFHVIHRFLHWPPVYRRFHSLHHRNINIGPW
ncbi:MAG: lathosterol oxidase, partial [Gammaproteobacteria bacterium]